MQCEDEEAHLDETDRECEAEFVLEDAICDHHEVAEDGGLACDADDEKLGVSMKEFDVLRECADAAVHDHEERREVENHVEPHLLNCQVVGFASENDLPEEAQKRQPQDDDCKREEHALEGESVKDATLDMDCHVRCPSTGKITETESANQWPELRREKKIARLVLALLVSPFQ